MSAEPKPSQVSREAPSPEWKCFGRYMEPGQPWEGSPQLCGTNCPDRFACWAKRNNLTKEKS